MSEAFWDCHGRERGEVECSMQVCKVGTSEEETPYAHR